MSLDNIKSQFPIFSKKINGKPLVYLDSSNSSQKPLCVINKLNDFYKNEFSNIGRSIHSLAINATNKFDETRVSVKNFINANSREEIIFTKNGTEAIRGLPSELEEAGLMDGLSRIGVILKITLPLSLPALASVSLYVFMIAWNEFLFAFMFLDDPDIFTLSRGVVSLNSSEVPRQHLMAGAVIATVPVLFIFLWFERFLVQGLTAGSVKG